MSVPKKDYEYVPPRVGAVKRRPTPSNAVKSRRHTPSHAVIRLPTPSQAIGSARRNWRRPLWAEVQKPMINALKDIKIIWGIVVVVGKA